MWGSRNPKDERVTCVACGRELPRGEAREYDKEGDRFSRRGKEFEHVCKACHRDLCLQPRDELEGLLVDLERDAPRDRETQEEFLRRYSEAVEERYGSLERK